MQIPISSPVASLPRKKITTVKANSTKIIYIRNKKDNNHNTSLIILNWWQTLIKQQFHYFLSLWIANFIYVIKRGKVLDDDQGQEKRFREMTSCHLLCGERHLFFPLYDSNRWLNEDDRNPNRFLSFRSVLRVRDLWRTMLETWFYFIFIVLILKSFKFLTSIKILSTTIITQHSEFFSVH